MSGISDSSNPFLSLFLLLLLARLLARRNRRKPTHDVVSQGILQMPALPGRLPPQDIQEGLPPSAGYSLTSDHGPVGNLLFGDSPFIVSLA